MPGTTTTSEHYDAIVIGGGITGAGTARDCALRGLRVLLLERFDLAHGATGRNHGLLHSGARYAVTDPESAAECMAENRILRHIARHCIEPTDGLFVTLPDDDPGYQATFVDACRQADIPAEIIDPADALQLEPALNPALAGAVRVPDAAVNPFALTMANVLDARLHGATVLTYHEVTGLIVAGGRVVGVTARCQRSGRTHEFRSSLVINAAGIWGTLVARRAGVEINMFPAKGALLIYAQRVNRMIVNRCRRPSNADIIVPDGAVCVVGTTSDRIAVDDIDDMRVTAQEVRTLMNGGEQMFPALSATRVLRAYAGVRPLVASDDDPSGRSISRGIVCLDHEQRDRLPGLLTITGGKMMTYRLMAQVVTDLACRKLGVDAACLTATAALPGSEGGEELDSAPVPPARRAATRRHGTLAHDIAQTEADDRALVCECEGVTVGEVKYAIEQLHARRLNDLRRGTRLGMGPCQGKACACRAADLLGRLTGDIAEAEADLRDFLDERWKGMSSVAWGGTLREAQVMATIYRGLCGLEQSGSDRKEVEA